MHAWRATDLPLKSLFVTQTSCCCTTVWTQRPLLDSSEHITALTARTPDLTLVNTQTI
jgi:hypothetical protein